ncbi:MAG: hypothetical protein P8123_01105 [bacterium]
MDLDRAHYSDRLLRREWKVDGLKLDLDNEALSRVRAALGQAKKKLDSGALPRSEGSGGEASHAGPALLRLQKMERVNRILRTVIILLFCGAVVAAASIIAYHAIRMRAMRHQVGAMSARIEAVGEERERELQRHSREVARLSREVQELRRGRVEKVKQPRKKFLGIF